MAKASDNKFPKVLITEGTTPTSPAAGNQGLFIDSADHKLKRVNSSGTVTTIEGGGGGTPAYVGCAVERTATQNVNPSTWTVINYTATDLYDASAMHDPSTNPSRITIPTGMGGVWRFTATDQLAGGGTGVRAFSWKKNGADLADRYGSVYEAASPAYSTIVNTSVELLLVAGDYIEKRVYHENGSAMNITGAHLTATFLGA